MWHRQFCGVGSLDLKRKHVGYHRFSAPWHSYEQHAFPSFPVPLGNNQKEKWHTFSRQQWRLEEDDQEEWESWTQAGMGSKRAQTYRRRKVSKAALCWKPEGDRRLKSTSFCLDWGTPPKTTVLLLKWQERTGNWEEMLILSLFWWRQGTPGSHTSALRAGITLLNRSAKGYTDSKTTKQWEWSDVASLGQTLFICAE